MNNQADPHYDRIEAIRIYAEAILESIDDFNNPTSMKNNMTVLYDARDYSHWILETIKPVLNVDNVELNEYKEKIKKGYHNERV